MSEACLRESTIHCAHRKYFLTSTFVFNTLQTNLVYETFATY